MTKEQAENNNVHQLFGIGGSNVSKSFPLHWRSPLFSLIEAWFWLIPTQRDGCQRANIKQLSRRPKCRQCLSIYGNNDLRIPCLYTQPRHNQRLFLFFYAWASISIPNIIKAHQRRFFCSMPCGKCMENERSYLNESFKPFSCKSRCNRLLIWCGFTIIVWNACACKSDFSLFLKNTQS